MVHDGEPTPRLEMRGISKTFPGVKALNGVQLKAWGGEVHALMGENGAGKSTLMKILSGAYQADPGGEILIDGQPVAIDGPARGRSAGHRDHLPGAGAGAQPDRRREHLSRRASRSARRPRRPRGDAAPAAEAVLDRLGAPFNAARPSSATFRSPNSSSSKSPAPCTRNPASS